MQKESLRRGFDYTEIKGKLEAADSGEKLFEAIVNVPFDDKLQTSLIFLGIVVLLLVNKKTGLIDRVAVTDNELAAGTKKMSVKKFEDIKIPVNDKQNIIARAIETGMTQGTNDWKYLFTPALKPREARLNQAGGAIAYSAVYPLAGVRDGGALIFSYFQYPEKIGPDQVKFMQKYSQLVSEVLSR